MTLQIKSPLRHFKEHFRILHEHFSPGISMTHHICSRQVKTHLPNSRKRPYIILSFVIGYPGMFDTPFGCLGVFGCFMDHLDVSCVT